MPETELPGEQAARAVVASRFGRRFEAADRLLSFALSVISQGGVNITRKGIKQLVPKVAFGLYMRACKTYRAVLITAEVGLGEDAFILGRSLFETAVAVFFILEREHADRAQMYIAHLQVVDLRMIKSWKGTPGIKRMATKKRLDTAEKRVAAAEAELGAEMIGRLKRNWSGESLEVTAQKLGWGSIYQIFYRRASRHGHAADLPSHMSFTDEGVPILHTVPSEEELLDEVLSMTYALVWGIVSRVNECFGLDHDAELKELEPNRDADEG